MAIRANIRNSLYRRMRNMSGPTRRSAQAVVQGNGGEANIWRRCCSGRVCLDQAVGELEYNINKAQERNERMDAEAVNSSTMLCTCTTRAYVVSAHEQQRLAFLLPLPHGVTTSSALLLLT